MKNINKVPQGIALRLRRICDTTKKYESRADENKDYLLALDYKPSLVDKQFKKSAKYQEKMQGNANLELIRSVKSNF